MIQAKHLCAFGLIVATLAGGCGSFRPNSSRAFVEWATDHAVPIEDLDSPLPEPSMQSLRDAIGTARVVGIGESRHDTREQLLLKGLLVKHMIVELGFQALILEESFPHAEMLDHYVTTGEGDLRTIMNRLAGWYVWDTEEMLEFFKWIRQANVHRPPDRMVRIYGMDITAPAPGVRAVLDHLYAAGVTVPFDEYSLGLDLQEGDHWPATWERYASASDERRFQLTNNYEALMTLVNELEGTHEYTRRLGELGRTGNLFFSSSSREEGGVIRERGMADTVHWILDHQMAGDKAIVWAHNLHVARSSFRMPGLAEGDLIPMGVHLDKSLGDHYLAIGATFGTGSYPADLPPGERVFEVAPNDAMDRALDALHIPYFFLDLRDTEDSSTAAQWLQQNREWVAQDATASLTPGDAFDLVYFVNEISRAQPTPAALERFQSIGP
ncbi:MAG: erythromycin esterase family protein [Acidobacteriota bacterium]|nr:erythromycin esterase family protein [Acidobacteriota bacterium]MDH3785892.1 erythromycin esterase family protein [Acidobacteriota bacterium]